MADGENGWIKLHRQITAWEWYKDGNTFRLFVHLLLTANHEDSRWQGCEIKRGQLVTGLHSLHRDTAISIQSLRTSLERLKSTNEITIKSTNKFSIVTITNYELYQEGDNKQSNKPANKQLTINQQTTNNKQEYKNDKKYSNNHLSSLQDNNSKTITPYTEEFEKFWNLYPKRKGKGSAFKAWGQAIKKRRIDGKTLFSFCEATLSWQIDSQDWVKDDGQYIPMPSTYLNQSRWEDERTIGGEEKSQYMDAEATRKWNEEIMNYQERRGDEE